MGGRRSLPRLLSMAIDNKVFGVGERQTRTEPHHPMRGERLILSSGASLSISDLIFELVSFAANLNGPTRLALCNGRHVAAPVLKLCQERGNGVCESDRNK